MPDANVSMAVASYLCTPQVVGSPSEVASRLSAHVSFPQGDILSTHLLSIWISDRVAIDIALA